MNLSGRDCSSSNQLEYGGFTPQLVSGPDPRHFRDSSTSPELIEPGKVYRYEIDLWVTSNVFLSGHPRRREIAAAPAGERAKIEAVAMG
ncbi:MAG: hypothetical protein HY717_22100 [Planctomycetes bacterium]|nr:hypothetical protein [Planctomycetota bacterium]